MVHNTFCTYWDIQKRFWTLGYFLWFCVKTYEHLNYSKLHPTLFALIEIFRSNVFRFWGILKILGQSLRKPRLLKIVHNKFCTHWDIQKKLFSTLLYVSDFVSKPMKTLITQNCTQHFLHLLRYQEATFFDFGVF